MNIKSYATYKENVYLRDSLGNFVFTRNNKGEITAAIIHRIGDIILNEDGKPMTNDYEIDNYNYLCSSIECILHRNENFTDIRYAGTTGIKRLIDFKTIHFGGPRISGKTQIIRKLIDIYPSIYITGNNGKIIAKHYNYPESIVFTMRKMKKLRGMITKPKVIFIDTIELENLNKLYEIILDEFGENIVIVIAH